jgi:hypothetical protein
MRDYEAPVRAAAERRPHREEDSVEKRRLTSSSYFSHNQVDAFLERSGDRLPVAVDQRSRSDSPIRQSDIARLVCRSRSANLSDVLDIPNVFSAVRFSDAAGGLQLTQALRLVHLGGFRSDRLQFIWRHRASGIAKTYDRNSKDCTAIVQERRFTPHLEILPLTIARA